MRKRYLYILASAVLLQSCTDNSYRGTIDIAGVSDEPMPVIIVVGNPDNMFISKGSGAIDNETEVWKNAPVYVYSFRKDLNTSFDRTSSENAVECLVDGSKDRDGAMSGKMARIGELDSYVTWEGPEDAVYYPLNTQPYDFYAYYIDDMQIPDADFVRTPDEISFPVEIDGSQDLMSAKATLLDEQLENAGYTDEDKANITNYAYSAYTAALNIQPVIYFKHHLVRLRFDVYSGFEETTGKKIYVDRIEVRSKTKGVFTVASKSADRMGVDFSGDDRPLTDRPLLTLKDKGGAELQRVELPYAGAGIGMENIYEGTPVRIGESLLVAPDTEYQVILTLTEVLESGRHHQNVSRTYLRTSAGNSFLPGNQYTVRFAVYGVTEVGTSVTLTPWGDGGSLEVGQDSPPVAVEIITD